MVVRSIVPFAPFRPRALFAALSLSLSGSSPAGATAAPASAAQAPPAGTAAATPRAAPPSASPNPPDASSGYEFADLDPDNDHVVGPPEPLAGCEERLKRAGIAFRAASLPLKTERARGAQIIACGAEQVVSYRGGPAKIRYSSWPTLTCRMALSLARWEQVLQ